MGKKVLVLDTSLLVVWLRVPTFESAGHPQNPWDWDRVDKKLQERDVTIVLPLATLIETGNNICRCTPEKRRAPADRLAEVIRKSVEGQSPWAIFSDQSSLWERDKLLELAGAWPALTTLPPDRNGLVRCLSMGDTTITRVADHYWKAGYEVEIVTSDVALQRFQPSTRVIPRRRSP